MVLTGHGGLEMIEYRQDIETPTAGVGEVLVEVGACGMNRTDINTRVGWYSGGSWGGGLSFPRIQGADPVGRIVATGLGVDDDRVGQRVLIDPWLRADAPEAARYLGSEVDGGYAEYLVVPSENAHAVHSALTDVELATFPCSYSTAEHMLSRAGAGRDDLVLVTGASGGVGSALVQLAKRRGARVVALTSEEKTAEVGDLGADFVVERSSAGMAERIVELTGGVHILADIVGGEMFTELLGTVVRGGHCVVAGAAAGPLVTIDLRTLYLRDLTVHGATMVPDGVFADLVGYIERSEIKPVVAASFSLQHMALAQETFQQGRHVGAIVVEVAG